MSDFANSTNRQHVEHPRLSDWTDRELLHVYIETGAEDALREIVARYGGMIYSICLRVLGDRHMAEDAVQITLLLFCRKARRISRSAILPGWLAKVARTAALDARRRTLAQRRREGEAARRRDKSSGEVTTMDPQLAAHLDEALGSLPRKYHDAVVLRHLSGLSEAETAEALGCPRSTATSRVLRGLEKMRRFLSRRGHALAPLAVAGAFQQTQAAVPAGLAGQVVACCTGKAVVTSGILTAVKGVESVMFWAKAKLAAWVTAGAMVAGTVSGVALHGALAGNPGGAGADAKSAVPAYGAADFVPSADRPVGYGGDGSFWYPGATPPFEFQDGTPKQVTVVGNSKPFWDVESTGRRNVRWKVPVPGWGDSQPIVVGQKDGAPRVINIYGPHWVVCYDGDTGKEVWRDELAVMTLPTIDKDRRTIKPVPDAAMAKKLQKLYEMSQALLYVRRNGETLFTGEFGGGVADAVTKRPELRPLLVGIHTQIIARLMDWRKQIQADFPGDAELLKAIEIAVVSAHKTAAPLGVALPTELAGKNLPIDERGNGFGSAVEQTIRRAGFESAAGIHAVWAGHVSVVAECPVSDGEIVFAAIGTGQMAAYEVATGKRLWAWRDPTMGAVNCDHYRSPLMFGDRILVRANGTPNHHGVLGLACLDKRTGAVLWEVGHGDTGAHGTVMAPKVAVLDDGKGGTLPVVIRTAMTLPENVYENLYNCSGHGLSRRTIR